MNRRAYLASTAGILAGFAGCIENGTTGTGSEPTTETPTQTPAESTNDESAENETDDGVNEERSGEGSDTPSEPGVTVDSLVLQRGTVVPTSPDSIGIADDDGRYVVASVTVDGDLPLDAFLLEAGDDAYRPTTLENLYRTQWGDDQWYSQETGQGLVAFDPTTPVDVDTVQLSWPGHEYAVGGSIPDRLGRPAPEFAASLDVPETHAGTTAPPVNIEVTNEGDVEGRFLGALNRMGPAIAYAPIRRISELVGPGESTTITVQDSWYDGPGEDRVGDGEPDLTYDLQHPDGSDSADIAITESD